MNMNMDMGHMKMNGTNSTHDHGDHMMMDMSMAMYFHFDFKDYVLIKEWMPMSTAKGIYACLAILLLGIALEGIKYGREMLQLKQTQQASYGNSFVSQLVNGLHLLQSLLHGLQYLVSYSLMLIAMTYQVYYFLSIIVGCTLGYLLFTPLTAKLRAKYQSFSDPCC